jgi:peptide/nickel transport system substrate-binding protein
MHALRKLLLSVLVVASMALTGGLLIVMADAPTSMPESEVSARGDVPLLPSQVAAPVANGTLVDVQSIAPETLDPHWLYDSASERVTAQIYETLLMRPREDPTTWVPQLATEWEVSDDVQTFTFTIRSGVTFHAGGTLEPHDVAYSMQRALLQDRMGGPHWMTLEAFFGVYTIEDLAKSIAGVDQFEDVPEAALVETCETVKAAIVADDGAGTVAYHLHEPSSWFLAMLENISVGAVLDMEWMAANGGWDGSCETWVDYHDPTAQESILYDQANGTGPFQLTYSATNEIRLDRYDAYWRSNPAWEGGPSGPAALDTVLLKYEADWTVRRDMLLNGQADLAYVPSQYANELAPHVWGRYDGYEDRTPTIVHPTGTLRLFSDLPSIAMTPAQFNYQIVTDTNPYIGSGALDGAGIPGNFFSDEHVRKAFNHAMDWGTLISDTLNGDAIRSRGPIPKGMLGYDDTQPVYVYSPTLAMQEFQQAWGGQVWSQGFSMTLAYNEGNDTRQAIAEILAQNLNAITDSFNVSVVGMPWEELLAARRAGQLPIYVGGWLEDYHHPYNWVHTFLHSQGAYGQVQNFPSAMAAQFDAKIEACALLTDLAAAQTCYEELQNMSYEQAAAMWGYQGIANEYVRTEVRGYYYNPATSSYPYYYALSKGAPPALGTASATVNSTLNFTGTQGTTTTVDVPAGAVSETSVIIHTPDVAVSEQTTGDFWLLDQAFDFQVCPGGDCVDDYAFSEPVMLTLYYTDQQLGGLDEADLQLYTWNGTDWVDVVTDCGWTLGLYERYPEENKLVVPVCHFSSFALFSPARMLYLPLVLN